MGNSKSSSGGSSAPRGDGGGSRDHNNNNNGGSTRSLELEVPRTNHTPERNGRGNKRNRRPRRGSEEDSATESDVEATPQRPKISYWQMIRGGYNELVNAIIRPPRANYELEALGPPKFRLRGQRIIREDIELVNDRGLKLQCSHWKPYEQHEPMPCMIYLHGNASCRAEALECLPLILSAGITLFALDFSGSGMSDGKYISLGWFERDDVKTVVDHLRSKNEVTCIGLFGRSMGAVTALLHGDRDPSIACMVVDSTFSSLRQLSRELVDHAQVNLPRFAIGIALRMVRSSVKSRAGFDINKLEPIAHAEKCFIPCLFGAASGDKFIRPQHSQDVHDRFAGDKNIIIFDGDHNSARPRFFYDSVGVFLHNTMIAPFGSSASSTRTVPRFLGELGVGGDTYRMPAPLSSTGAGLGISVGVPSNRNLSSPDGLQVDEDAYYEAMLQQALEMSLAEARQQNEKGERNRNI